MLSLSLWEVFAVAVGCHLVAVFVIVQWLLLSCFEIVLSVVVVVVVDFQSRFINDASGTGKASNVHFKRVWLGGAMHVMVIVTQPIRRGEEILDDYGDRYWLQANEGVDDDADGGGDEEDRAAGGGAGEGGEAEG